MKVLIGMYLLQVEGVEGVEEAKGVEEVEGVEV
jgi:hypothetical protein